MTGPIYTQKEFDNLVDDLEKVLIQEKLDVISTKSACLKALTFIRKVDARLEEAAALLKEIEKELY